MWVMMECMQGMKECKMEMMAYRWEMMDCRWEMMGCRREMMGCMLVTPDFEWESMPETSDCISSHDHYMMEMKANILGTDFRLRCCGGSMREMMGTC
jgi:hypothetical protein